MKIGRTALDEDAVRLIEELNPQVEFDWPRIIKGQDQPPSEPRVPVEVRKPRGARPQERSERRPEPRPEPRAVPVPEAREAPAESARAEFTDLTAAPPTETTPPADPVPDVIVAAHARIGAEGVARLRARYAEIEARIAERTTDPERREALRAQAIRLSPDAWITDDDVTQGLDQYESVLASLREVVGRKRRRRRRGAGRGAEGSATGPSGQADAQGDANEVDQTTESGEASESREEPEDPGL